ncbi:MAG: hypothetical protein JSV04_02220 [Candidatus Heimdallarchaeota archaeon]|nr:MAG: hypothetical protein JSV04_02220 [Candidatus Heimdallarchaeota archaeon]
MKKEAKTNFQKLILAILLSIIFTFGGFFLMFTTMVVLNDFFEGFLQDPWYVHYSQYQQYKQNYDDIVAFLVPIGYLCFIMTLLLILLGLILKRYHISLFGAYILYLPLFGAFSFAMSAVFAGIGVIQIIWLPFFHFAPDFLNAGAIILFPLYLQRSGVFEEIPLAPSLIGALLGVTLLLMVLSIFLGLFIFVFGVITWLYGKFQGKAVIDFWIYRFSRHPQYLGLILFNYGLLLFPLFFPFLTVPFPTLPWVLLTLIIIGMAITEENTLLRECTEEYTHWRTRTPFLIPLPKGIISVILWPTRLLLRKEWPERNKEILVILLFYGLLLISLSLPLFPFMDWNY